MKSEPLPLKISEYIRDNFRGEFLTSFKTVYNSKKQPVFFADVSYDDMLHHLKFNAQGMLIESYAEPLFEPDAYEGPTSEN